MTDARLADNLGKLLKVLLAHPQSDQKALAIGMGHQALDFFELHQWFDLPFAEIAGL